MTKDNLARYLIKILSDSNQDYTLDEESKALLKLALIEYLKKRHKKYTLTIEDEVPP